MPNFGPHIRVSFGGRLLQSGEPDEIWSCNVSVVPRAGDYSDEAVESYLSDITAGLKTWLPAAQNQISNQATLNSVKANPIAPDGSYATATATHFRTFADVSGGVAPIHPHIMSIVTSWHTDVGRGAGSKGRIFLPNPTYGSAGSMVISNGEAANLVNAGKRLLTVLQANTLGGAQPFADPVVASGVNAATNIITQVWVGNVLDVQRRRKNAYNEIYSSATFS